MENTKHDTRQANRRGSRHLRVGLEISPAGVRVASMWAVDQPSVQSARLVEPILARIDLATRPVLVEAFADPRVTRGTFRKDLGHSYGVEQSGVVHVSVPFDDLRQLAEVRIRVLDASNAGLGATEPVGVAALFDSPPDSVRVIGDVDTASLRKHPDWLKVAAALVPADPGRFEIYLDRAGEYRWRFRRASGECVADSGQGYASREACENDVRWVRSHAPSSPVVSLDLLEGTRC